MKKKIIKNFFFLILKIDLLEDLKLSLFKFNFVIICIIHKMLVLTKNQLNYFKDSIFECFF